MGDSNISAGQKLENFHEYRTKLSQFEGPLDILLHFVKVDDLDIYNIPISKITKDFLEYINIMKDLDIELAGEFLVMASELMKIKARMLIPQIDEEGNVVEEDPRLTLVRKLIEYKRFKDVSEMVSELEDDQKKKSFRRNFDNDFREYDSSLEIDKSLKNVTIFNLIKAYKRVISNVRREIVHPIELLDINPENQKEFLMNALAVKSEIEFDELIINVNVKLQIICLFLAILQLSLDGEIKIRIIDNDPSRFTVCKRTYTDIIQ
ncbi:MAG: segregation/condensation protein A [Ignavibacteria bacterium]|nr:segregation/condensation protein A [Ignavibacteria bacterium]